MKILFKKVSLVLLMAVLSINVCYSNDSDHEEIVREGRQGKQTAKQTYSTRFTQEENDEEEEQQEAGKQTEEGNVQGPATKRQKTPESQATESKDIDV